MGEGEETIIDLLSCNDVNSQLNQIKGLGFKINEKIFINSRRKRRTDLDEISFPDWKTSK